MTFPFGLSFSRPSNIMEFSPLSVPNLEWWLRADLGTTLNLVSQWADQSGAGDSNRNFVASVQRPTLITSVAAFNNKPVINFDTSMTNQEMTQAGLWSHVPSGPFTIITVGKDDAQIGASKHRPWIGDANVNQWYQATFPNTSISSVTPAFGSSTGVTGISDVSMNSTTFDTGAPVIFMSEFNDNNSTIRINEDTPETTQDWGTVAAPGKPELQQLDNSHLDGLTVLVSVFKDKLLRSLSFLDFCPPGTDRDFLLISNNDMRLQLPIFQLELFPFSRPQYPIWHFGTEQIWASQQVLVHGQIKVALGMPTEMLFRQQPQISHSETQIMLLVMDNHQYILYRAHSHGWRWVVHGLMLLSHSHTR
jgi:hypothetical protein